MKIALTLAILRNRFEEEKASKIVDEKLRRSWGGTSSQTALKLGLLAQTLGEHLFAPFPQK